jgi:hypothetical protein
LILLPLHELLPSTRLFSIEPRRREEGEGRNGARTCGNEGEQRKLTTHFKETCGGEEKVAEEEIFARNNSRK